MLPPGSIEKEYEQIARTPFDVLGRQNLLYGRHTFGAFLLYVKRNGSCPDAFFFLF